MIGEHVIATFMENTSTESDVIVSCASLNYNIDKLPTKELDWLHDLLNDFLTL